jgi:AraC-like DNA-binding protein
MTLLLFYQKFGVSENRRKSKAAKIKFNTWLSQKAGNDPVVIAIQKNKYYQDPNLDIRTLSEELELPYHELSAKINQEYSQNFNEFINRFRIQEVVNALQNQQHQSFTIMGLAQKAGFKSASAFYAAFKKEKGTTPTHYLEQIAKTS